MGLGINDVGRYLGIALFYALCRRLNENLPICLRMSDFFTNFARKLITYDL